jgi:hypothetical protein
MEVSVTGFKDGQAKSFGFSVVEKSFDKLARI